MEINQTKNEAHSKFLFEQRDLTDASVSGSPARHPDELKMVMATSVVYGF
jgi:hypothetical protein